MWSRLNWSWWFGEENWIIAWKKSDIQYLSWEIKWNPQNVCLCLKAGREIENNKSLIHELLNKWKKWKKTKT